MKSGALYEQMFRDWSRGIGITMPEYKEKVIKEQLAFFQSSRSYLNTSALTIVDIEKNKYLHVDEDIEKVTGVARTVYLTKGPKALFAKAVFSHLPRLVTSTLHQRNFFSKLDENDHERYVFNRELAYRGPSQKHWVLHQVLSHLKNPKGHIFGVVVLQTKIMRLKFDSKFRYYIFDKLQNEVVYPTPDEKVSNTPKLTKRENEIVAHVLKGKSSAEIAKELQLSFHTVRTHRKNIFTKLNCHNMIDLIRFFENSDS